MANCKLQSGRWRQKAAKAKSDAYSLKFAKQQHLAHVLETSL